MECPVCGEKLREIERYGVTIDLCPGCKGCWLDRGELEKIAALEDRDDRDRDRKKDDDDHDRDHDHRDNRSGGSDYAKPKKRSSLLGDILGGLGGE
jgi:Zn-finger nucleic acid-binding protein